MAIIVQKFGGASLANAEQIRRAARRVIERMKAGYQVVVVASARGEQAEELLRDALELNPNPPKRELDQLLSTREQQTVSLFAMALDAMGYKAISLTGGQIHMITDSVYCGTVDCTNTAATALSASMVTVAGFAEPVTLPSQRSKFHPTWLVAVNVTTAPGS
ncbi:MAG: hypothetical protein MUC88_16190 [Planctomycetes bacterium]|nr:hypothetical protein [Planctomycetota bacterium]